MTNVVKKVINGYVGFNNLPNQIHRRYVKNGFQFTLMVVGESGLGKTTFINTLFNTQILPPKPATPAAVDDVTKKAITVEDHIHRINFILNIRPRGEWCKVEIDCCGCSRIW